MTPDELTAIVARLRELAAKATPGPWHGWVISGTPASGPPRGEVVGPTRVPYDHSLLFGPADALFMAACDPQTVLALCDAVAERDALRAKANVAKVEAAQ